MDDDIKDMTKDDGEEDARSASESADVEHEPKGKVTKKEILMAICINFLMFTVMLSFGIMGPFFPAEAASKGVTGLQVGFIFGVFQLVMFIMSPICGIFINRIGPKNMVVFGPMICGLTNIAFAFVNLDNDKSSFLALCIILRIVCGAGSSMLQTSGYSVMSSLFPNHLGVGLGALSTCAGAGMAIGPSVGGGLYAAGGFRLPFLVLGGIVIITSCIMFFLIPKMEKVNSLSGDIVPLLKSPGCLIVYVLVAISMGNFTAIEPILGPFLNKNFNLSVGIVGLFFMITPVIYAVLAPFYGFLVDKKGFHWQLMIVGNAICGIAYLFVGPCPTFEPHPRKSVAGVAVSLVIVGLAAPPVTICSFPVLNMLARAHGYEPNLQTYGIVSGFYSSAAALGGFIGPVLAGHLAEIYGFGWATSTNGFISLFMVPVLLTYIIVQVVRGDWPLEATIKSSGADEKTPIIALENISE